MRNFQNECCLDAETACDVDLMRARLEVHTEASSKTAVVSVSDIYQHGQQVHALRLEVVDEDGHNAILTLPPVQLELIGRWLTEKATQLQPVECGA